MVGLVTNDDSTRSPRNTVSRNLIGCVGAGDGGTFVDGEAKYDCDLSIIFPPVRYSLELYAEPLILCTSQNQ